MTINPNHDCARQVPATDRAQARRARGRRIARKDIQMMTGPHNLRDATTADEVTAMLLERARDYVADLTAKGAALSALETRLTENAYASGFADGVKSEMMTVKK